MHKVLDNISDLITIPFIHIVDPTGQALVNARLSKVGLIGTKVVMESNYLSDRYKSNYGIDIVTPDEENQVLVDKIIFDELVKGKIIEASRQEYIEICRRLKDRGAQGIILGCTEICLLLRQSDIPEIPLFNTTELHAKAAVDMAIEETAYQVH